MDLVVTAEERDFAASLRDLFGSHWPSQRVRELRAADGPRFPAELWAELARAEVLGLALPTDVGGVGGGLDDLAVLYQEAGRALCPTIVQSTIHLGLALDRLGTDEQRKRVLPALCRGGVRGTIALCDPYDAAEIRPRLVAEPAGDGPDLVLSGRLDYVTDADLADLVLCTARVASDGEPEQVVALLVDPTTAGVTTRPLPAAGGDRWHEVVLDRVRVSAEDVIGGLAPNDLLSVSLLVRALQCVDMVGGAEAVLERTVTYTRERVQFGRPIASFQAAQHLVADMHIAVQAARLAARSAVFWHGRGRDAIRTTAIAVMRAVEAYRRATLDAHQLHGGMGYVLETDLHLWSERARVLAVEGGGPDVATRWLEGELGLG